MSETPRLEPKVIRLALTGCGGTGKSTVMEEVAKVLDLDVLASTTRSVAAKYGFKGEDDDIAQLRADPDRQYEMQLEMHRVRYEQFLRAIESGRGFVTDRCPLDDHCYGLLTSWMSERYTAAEVQRREARVYEIMRQMTMVVFFPTRVISDPKDPYRTTRESKREAVDAIFRGYLARWSGHFNIMSMTTGDPKLRVKHLLHFTNLILGETAEDQAKDAAAPNAQESAEAVRIRVAADVASTAGKSDGNPSTVGSLEEQMAKLEAGDVSAEAVQTALRMLRKRTQQLSSAKA